jgi:hypothetical protein
MSRKRCDGVKPVCGRCGRQPDRCKWPEGKPSRSGLINLRTGGRLEENLPHGKRDDKSDGDHTLKDGPGSNNVIGAHLPESLPAELQRLEQVRVRILESTRAYLGTKPELQVNTSETNSAQLRHSQGQRDLQESRAQARRSPDTMSDD